MFLLHSPYYCDQALGDFCTWCCFDVVHTTTDQNTSNFCIAVDVKSMIDVLYHCRALELRSLPFPQSPRLKVFPIRIRPNEQLHFLVVGGMMVQWYLR